MATNFQKRRIKITFQLMAGSFADGSDTLTVENASCTVNYQNFANCFAALPRIALRVYGLSYETLKRLVITKTQALTIQKQNRVRVEVSDGNGGMALLFDGAIYGASVDFNTAPNIALVIAAFNCGEKIADKAPPLNYQGEVEIKNVLNDVISGQMGLEFFDGGVTAKGNNVSLNGSSVQKLRTLARDYRLSVFFNNDVIAVSPLGNSSGRERLEFEISINTGLLGFPTLTEYGASCKILYNPAILVGDIIKLKSSINSVLEKNRTPTEGLADGEWFVNGMDVEISSETPGGDWSMELRLHNISTQATA